MDLNKPFPWEKAKRILVTTHAFVDPDALGSVLAMGSFFNTKNKDVDLVVSGGVPKNLDFLLGEQKITSNLDKSFDRFDLVLVLDCGDAALTQIPELFYNKVDVPVVNIDHHQDNRGFGDFNFTSAKYASTTQVLYEIFKIENHEINSYEATALLAGIMGDTGSFRHANTGAEVLEIAGNLLTKGASFSRIVKNLFAGKTVGQLKAWSYALEKASLDKKTGALVSAMTQKDLEKLDVVESDFEGVVDILNTFPEAKFAAFVRQRGDTVKFSLRSEEYKGTDVSKLAQKFGGGGHKLSAGFTIQGQLKRDNDNIYIKPSENC